MQIIINKFDDYGFEARDLTRYTERTVRVACVLCAGATFTERLNGRAVAHCALCKGEGTVAVAQIACEDCQQFTALEDLYFWSEGMADTHRNDTRYSVKCKGCRDLTAHHAATLERRADDAWDHVAAREADRAEWGY